jgi:hypothetical protein
MIPLNEMGGTAAVVRARVADDDLARLIRLAVRRRKSRSQMTRELLRLALDQIEAAGRAPPGEDG